MSKNKRPWIILYEQSEYFNDKFPIHKITWMYGTEEEVVERFEKDNGYFVKVKFIVGCNHYLEVNDE